MINRDEWMRRAEVWYGQHARKVYEESAAKLKGDAGAREELARRLREHGFGDATAGTCLKTVSEAVKSANTSFGMKQDKTATDKAAYYGRQLAILGHMAVATGHPRASTVARLDEGWKRIGEQQAPGKLGSPVAERIVAETRTHFGDMSDAEALGQAIGFAQHGLYDAQAASEKAMQKVKAFSEGFGGIDSLKTLKAHDEAHAHYMIQMARKNAFERLNNVLVDGYSRLTGDDTSYAKVDVGDLSAVEKAKFDAGGANLARAWREHLKERRGVPDHDGFARTMLAGGIDDGKLVKFMAQKVDGIGKDMVPDIVASAKLDVERKAVEDAARRLKQANVHALTLAATGRTPEELRPKVSEPKVSPVPQPASVGGPAETVRKAKPAEQAKPRQERPQPVVKPQEVDGFSFMRRLKEMRDKILVKVGLKELESRKTSPKPSSPTTLPAEERPEKPIRRAGPMGMAPTAEDLKLMKAKEKIDAAFAQQGGNEKRLDRPEAPGFKRDRNPPKPKHEMPTPSVGGFKR